MKRMGMFLMGGLFVALFTAGSAAAADPGPVLAGASCLTAAANPAQPVWLTEPGCYQMMDCDDSQYCWGQCPSATSAVCVNNVCQFTLPGGGTGGGGWCPEQRDCWDDNQCVYNGGSLHGTCVNNTCVC